MSIEKNIGCRIKEARLAKNLTAKELSLSLDKTVQMISQWETGKRIPTFETAKQLSKLLDVSISYIYCADTSNTDSSSENIKLYNMFELLDEKHSSLGIPQEMINTDIKELIAVKITDNSMENIFRKGDIVIINKEKKPFDGCYVLIKIVHTNQILFRKYHIDNSNLNSPTITLCPLNSSYEKIEFNTDLITVIGVCSDDLRLIS